MVITMTTDFGADSGACNPNLSKNWSNDVNLIEEELARARSWEQHSAWNQREREFARQVAVARAQRSAQWAERVAAYVARRAAKRRKRADLLAGGLR